MQQSSSQYPYWSSPTIFVLAAVGAAVGLGNVWRLPYLAEQYGGGAFLLAYCLALVFMALPLLQAQLILGRGRRGDLVSILRQWVADNSLYRAWVGMSYLALAGAVLVLSYYSVIAGWSMAYLMRAAAGSLETLDAAALRGLFLTLAGDPEKGLGWHTIFIVMVAIFVAHGVRRGLEPVARWLVGGTFLALLLLVAAAVGQGGEQAAMHLLRPDFAALGWRGVAEALLQAFFSLSLGVGVMLAFGVYLREQTSLLRVSVAVVVFDTLFALLSGYLVIALLMPLGQVPVAGLQLVFEVVPAAVSQTGPGWVMPVFFLMLLLVALSSAVALMEPVVVWAMARFRISRIYAAAAVGMLVWFLGLGTLLSFNLMATTTFLDRTVFDWLSGLSSRLLLPLVGLLLCLFAGRFVYPERLRAVWMTGDGRRSFAAWHWAMRYPARVGLILVLLYSLGVFDYLAGLW